MDPENKTVEPEEESPAEGCAPIPGEPAEEKAPDAPEDGETAPEKAEPVPTAEELLTAQAEALKKELAGEKDKYLRLAAEYDNYRKRSARERDNIYADVKADTITKLLPVFDNLARALANPTADEAYRKGVEMTMNQFLDTLKAMGVTPIEALGQTFDPNLHHAVMHVEDPEKGEQEVVAELQKGFRCGDKVIRFSMVQVAN